MVLKKVLLIIILLIRISLFAQQAETNENKGPASSREQRVVARHKWKEQRKLEREQKKAVTDYQKKLQTKKTFKRMSKTRAKGEQYRENKREFFLIRWFKYGRK